MLGEEHVPSISVRCRHRLQHGQHKHMVPTLANFLRGRIFSRQFTSRCCLERAE